MHDVVPYVAGFVALVPLAWYGRALRRERALRLRAERPLERIGAEQVPAERSEALDEPGRELEALGFEALGWTRELEALDGAEEPRLTRIYQHGDPVAFALLAPGELVFLSLAEDARKLVSASFAGHPWLGLKKHVVVDARAPSYTEQWQRHRDALAEQTEFVPRDVSLDELVVECQDSRRRAAERALERGEVVACADGRLRLGARVVLGRVLRASGPLANAACVALLIAALGVISYGPDATVPPAQPSPADPRAQEATRALRAGKLSRALDLREQVYGPESVEVAEVLEAFPAEPADARAAALVRQLRLIAIYEHAGITHASALARAYEAMSLLRANAEDFERAEAALRRAVALQPTSTASLLAFLLERQRFADARALAPAAPERCWLSYWEGEFAAARDCFAAPPAGIDLALATRRAGDKAAARRLLKEAGGLPANEPDPGVGWSAREQRRRAAERARVLGAL